MTSTGSTNQQNALRLCSANLPSIAERVQVPSYDRSKLAQSVVHIGVGGFHRAHQAIYLEEYARQTKDLAWGICGVGLLKSDDKMRNCMREQDNLYTVVERSASVDQARVVGVMTSYLFAPENPEAVIALLAAPSTRIVTLTITEGGYCFNQGTGAFMADHSDIQHDLKNPLTPRTMFGYVAEGLARRRKSGAKPFTILSCDNIVGNGDVTKSMLLSFVRLKDADLASWIEQNVTFPNSMVDRITPVTTEEDKSMVASKFGISDAWPVVCEPFKQWVVEDKFCNGRPEWERVGVQMTDDVHPYEVMKIRLLNAGHSSLGYLGYLAGLKYIFEITQDPEFQKYTRGMMDEEVTPLLKPVPGVNLEEYKQTLIERFSNPIIKDQATRICMDGSNKMPKFILPSIRESLQRGGSISKLTLCVAAWFRFLQGTDEQGAAIPLDDPMGPTLRELAVKGGKDPAALLTLHEIFGDLSTNQRFVVELRKSLESLYNNGARATLRAYIQ